ncbi:hypothetical protein [Aureliella helgolandensis]|uniref:DNA polymerase III subunit beta n=1 Tax=Aureliella helgolandensis TaxID=2527968 RepID=A0A518G859_9BACT|nr:hypothetical protein [Aureliella helgolandensis]QDV24778.1 hypothetical protein Q31a_31000 [Aureliella helgolandensis]
MEVTVDVGLLGKAIAVCGKQARAEVTADERGTLVKHKLSNVIAVQSIPSKVGIPGAFTCDWQAGLLLSRIKTKIPDLLRVAVNGAEVGEEATLRLVPSILKLAQVPHSAGAERRKRQAATLTTEAEKLSKALEMALACGKGDISISLESSGFSVRRGDFDTVGSLGNSRQDKTLALTPRECRIAIKLLGKGCWTVVSCADCELKANGNALQFVGATAQTQEPQTITGKSVLEVLQGGSRRAVEKPFSPSAVILDPEDLAVALSGFDAADGKVARVVVSGTTTRARSIKLTAGKTTATIPARGARLPRIPGLPISETRKMLALGEPFFNMILLEQESIKCGPSTLSIKAASQ